MDVMKITVAYAVAFALTLVAGYLEVKHKPEVYGPYLPKGWVEMGGAK